MAKKAARAPLMIWYVNISCPYSAVHEHGELEVVKPKIEYNYSTDDTKLCLPSSFCSRIATFFLVTVSPAMLSASTTTV